MLTVAAGMALSVASSSVRGTLTAPFIVTGSAANAANEGAQNTAPRNIAKSRRKSTSSISPFHMHVDPATLELGEHLFEPLGPCRGQLGARDPADIVVLLIRRALPVRDHDATLLERPPDVLGHLVDLASHPAAVDVFSAHQQFLVQNKTRT